MSHVVSVMRDPPPWLVGKAGASDGPLPFEHLHVKVEDTRAADMTPHFPVVSAFLSRAESAGGRALVHCAFGQSRSVTVVVAHLVMSNRGLSLGEALERMRSRRPTACPNPSFLEQLVRLELELRRRPLGPPTEPFPSLPPAWAFVSWRDPLRQATDSSRATAASSGAANLAPSARRRHLQFSHARRSRRYRRGRRARAPPVARRSTSTRTGCPTGRLETTAHRRGARRRPRGAIRGTNELELSRVVHPRGRSRCDSTRVVPLRTAPLARRARAGGSVSSGPAVPSASRLL